MGGSTRLKQEAIIEAEMKFRESFAVNTKKLEAKLAEPVPPISVDFEEYKGFFIRSPETFQLKTKSKDRNKQRLEFVRHVFDIYPVPAFMSEAWMLPNLPSHLEPIRGNYLHKFLSKFEHRLWYICMATGGSFYKEYGHSFFTKQENHIFLNSKHDLSIDKTVVYAIAYAECKNTGKALRIAHSKLSAFSEMNAFWKEIIRFFARLEPKSKESIDDILDYITYKRREDINFTIIGKGHTLESLEKKVEQWHQDLRRLKAIGEAFWEGIPVKNKEYTRKNRDGSVDTWKFIQIKSARDLQQEGNAMRHCVFSYKNRCISGDTSIWSVTFNDNRKLTIEVSRGTVVQVRGLANRVARPDEKNVIARWAMDCRFYYK